LGPTGGGSALALIAQPWVYEKVVTLDPGGQLKPVLATRVDRISGEQLRVELHSNSQFSDGTPVNEVDIVRSLESGGLRATRSDGALIIQSRGARLPPEALLLQAGIFRESRGKVLGSGPFAVASQTDTELRLTRRIPRAGRINDVRVIAYPTPRDAFAHTLKGDTNLIVDFESRWLEFFKGVPSLQIIRGTGRSTDAIIFNTDVSRAQRVQLAEVLGSKRVRELAYADAECSESRTERNDASTLSSGPALRVLSWGPFERLALAARRALADRGGEVSHVAPQEVLSRIKARDFDMVAGRPLRWPPSAIALAWRTGSPDNIVGYSNPAVDRAIDAGDWSAAESALRDDPPAAFVCTRDHLAVVDARIRNASLGPYELLQTLPDWEVVQ
jgi:hypothetical protein